MSPASGTGGQGRRAQPDSPRPWATTLEVDMRTTILIATLMLAVASAATLLRPARMKVDGVEAAAQD